MYSPLFKNYNTTLIRDEKLYGKKSILTDHLLKKYNTFAQDWYKLQFEWFQNVCQSAVYDFDTYLIIIHLLHEELNQLNEENIHLTFNQVFKRNLLKFKPISIKKISRTLLIPEETVRRKIKTLEKNKFINFTKDGVELLDKGVNTIKPQSTLRNIATLLQNIAKIYIKDKKKIIPNDQAGFIFLIQQNFSLAWKFWYDFQIAYVTRFRKINIDGETAAIFYSIYYNQILGMKHQVHPNIEFKNYIEFIRLNSKVGINALSITEILDLPRSNVLRKLNKLEKENLIFRDKKKLYYIAKPKKNHLRAFKNNLYYLEIFLENICNKVC